MFPQVTANLSQRWCTAAAKIDVGRSAISNDPHFLGKKVLVVTGERAEESPGRAKYLVSEAHPCTAGAKKGRLVHAWRPIHKWKEAEVWEISRRWGIRPHPAYELGWSRCSCQVCIFGSSDMWATVRHIDPERFERIAQYEEEFGKTIHRKLSVRQRAEQGQVFPATLTRPELVKVALSTEYTYDIRVPTRHWDMPAGAFGDAATGPS